MHCSYQVALLANSAWSTAAQYASAHNRTTLTGLHRGPDRGEETEEEADGVNKEEKKRDWPVGWYKLAC